MKTLIAYYSRNGENYFAGKIKSIEVGNTEKVALLLKKELNADIFKIDQVKPYSTNYRECVSEARTDFMNKARPALKDNLKSIDEYDKIYLGYPNYCGTMPMAVFTFLESFNFKDKKIYPFCTNEGSGFARSLTDLKNETGAEIINPLSLIGDKVDQDSEKILNWVKENNN